MARQTTLANLRAMFKAEVGSATNNTNSDAQINLLLSNMQKWLASEYDWPFLETRIDVDVGPQTQNATLPALNLERPVLVERFWGRSWEKLDYGIGSEEYNALNPALGQFSDPIQRWRFNDETGFEVWPVPATLTKVRFTGQRPLVALAADADVADLDDMMLVLYTAGEWLANRKQADAQLKLQKAQARMARVRASYPSRERCISISGGCQSDGPSRRNVGIVIAVAS